MEITVMEASGELDEQKNDDLLLLQHADNDSRLSNILKTGHGIDRHIVTIDEKYLRHCLELIYLTEAASSSSSFHPSSWDSPMINLFSYDLQKPSGELILGSITRGKSILSILESPLIYDQYVPPSIESSSTSSVYSDRPSSSSSFVSGGYTATGMLHVMWELGSPRFEFLLDYRKEAAYVAELVKPDQSPDYIYVFRGNQSQIVGRMRVSTSVTTLGFKETLFVLFGAAEDDTIARSKSVFRLKGFPGKFVEAFKRGTETNGGSGGGWSRQRRVNISESQFLPNLELAAIVVNERVCDRDQEEEEEEKSGWGMKFLRKAKLKETKDPSLDIVVASGVHGGPKGGPLGLIERCRSLGSCDCGGWDVGCPIKVLKARTNCKSGSSSSFDLLIEGSRGVASTIMKMENVNDSLYLLHMKSNISSLQSFAIAISFIHSRSPLHQLKQG